jgi:hypothetical protein
MERLAEDPACQIVEGRVDRALRRAVQADRGGDPRRGTRQLVVRSAAGPGRQVRLADGLEEQREHRRHRLGRLAVERVGIPLAVADDLGNALVAELDDHRPRAEPRPVLGAGDPERVAKG